MTRGVLAVAVGLGLAGILAEPGFAVTPDEQSARLDPRKVIEQSEQAIGRTVGNYKLTASTGAPLSLRDYRGKPLVISLIYTACSSACPPTTQHLISAVNEATRVLGQDRFNVLTVGFDARNDTPARMAQFASIQGVKVKNWRLASADPVTIDALLHDLGFSYVSVAGGFDHVTQTTIVDRDGKVYRSVYGDDFPLQVFIEPLKDAVYGTSSSFSMSNILNRIKFICTVYDPGAGRYRIDYGMAFGGVIAALSLLVFGGLIYREWIRTGRA
jgi:protein SCO1/2